MYLGWSMFIGLFVFGVQFFIEYRDWTDAEKDLTLRVAPGPCKTVIEGGGSEDLVDIGDGIVLITRQVCSLCLGSYFLRTNQAKGFNFDFTPGFMSALDLKTDKVMRVNMTNVPNRATFMAAPHGMSSWRDTQTGQLFIYVLTHPADADRIEVFEVLKGLTLSHVKTIMDPSFTFMNDLVLVGKDKFYITSIWRYRPKLHVSVEGWARMRNGRIVYYDGHKGREVASGYLMANGINMSPDMSVIYMAECGYKTVHAFKRDSTNNLIPMWSYDADTVVDNIDVDPATGDLWIGCHPIMWKIFDFYNLFGATRPSQVLRFKLRDGMVSEVEEIYSDDGSEIAGSTAAAYVNGKLVIGSVSSQTVVCDVNYLSPSVDTE